MERPRLTLSVSVRNVNLPSSGLTVFLGSVTALYTTAMPVLPICPLICPPETVNVLPEIWSVYVPSFILLAFTFTEAELPLTFTKTTPLVPRSL